MKIFVNILESYFESKCWYLYLDYTTVKQKIEANIKEEIFFFFYNSRWNFGPMHFKTLFFQVEEWLLESIKSLLRKVAKNYFPLVNYWLKLKEHFAIS